MGTTAPSDDERHQLTAALDRLRVTVAERQGFGRSTSESTTTLGAGVRCTTAERSATIESDLAPALGGDRAAPSPGMYMRAALGACLAMGYRLRAAERDVELTSVRVTVAEETDVRGLLFDENDVSPGPLALRYVVEIESPSDHDTVAELIDAGDRLSPILDALRRPQEVARTVSITPGRG